MPELLSAQMSLGCIGFSPALLVRWAWDPQQVVLCLSLPALNSPDSASCWEGLGATLSLGCDNPLPLHCRVSLYTQYSLCSGDQFCLPAYWLKHHWATQFLKVVTSPFTGGGAEIQLLACA